jgi:HEAT repeat protein
MINTETWFLKWSLKMGLLVPFVKWMGKLKSVQGLIDALSSDDWKARMLAAKILGEIGDSRSIQVLITTALVDFKDEVAQAATDSLKRFGTECVGSLVRTWKDYPRFDERNRQRVTLSEEDIHQRMKRIWIKISSANVVESLIGILSRQGFPPDRSKAAEILAEIRDPAAVDSLIKALQKPDPQIRTIVANVLGEINDSRAINPLVGAAVHKIDSRSMEWYRQVGISVDSIGLDQAEWDSRDAASIALRKIDSQYAIKELNDMLDDSDKYIRLYATRALLIIQGQLEPRVI